MNLSRVLFVLVLVVAPIVLWSTGSTLPPEVASHFGHAGQANSFMPREFYLLVMTALVTLLPLFVAATNGLVPRFVPKKMVRDPGYWMTPPRREASVHALGNFACLLGMLLSLFMLALHFLVLQANASQPPHLPMPAFFALLGVFLSLLAVWMLALFRRFRTPS